MKGSSNCFFFLWIVLLYVFSLSFFLRGFLLTRREIQLKSSKDGPFFKDQQYRKVVIFVVDALRYDFASYNNATHLENIPPFHNKLPVIHDLLSSGHAELYKFVADPPTTTMQRLKGLTTGSLPTFIDVGSNFASDEIAEDNLIQQLRSSHMNITFMGDDTWIGLFPNSFQHSYPFPSFDVWDIHTVDDTVTHLLHSELGKDNWNLLIAHCLGVDHVGHRYGPNHPIMAEKLKQMNKLISYVIHNMDEDTLLLLMGDHGMTRTGDHGGDSMEETVAALFVYSPALDLSHNSSLHKEVNQIDLVPTIATLMGVPIPYSNLGTVILDLIKPRRTFEASENHRNEEIQHILNLIARVKAIYSNVYQVWNYLKSYNLQTPISSREFQKLDHGFLKLRDDFQAFNVSHHCYEHCDPPHECCPKKEELEKFLSASQSFLYEAREMCRSMWARFDLSSMITGLVLFSITSTVHLVHIFSMQSHSTEGLMYFLIAVLSFIIRLLSDYLAIALVALSALYYCKSPNVRFNCLTRNFPVSAFLPVIMALLYTSNSFVVEEPYVAHFLSQILIWSPLIGLPRDSKSLLARLALSFFTRLGLLYFRCREEQYSHCETNSLHRSLSSIAAVHLPVILRLGLAIFACFSLVYVISSHFRIAKATLRLLFILSLYWISQLICVVFNIQESYLHFLPWSFYAYFLYSLLRQFIAIFQSDKYHSTNVNVNVLLLMWNLCLLLSGDGLCPGIVSVLANVFIVKYYLPKESNTSMPILYGILSMHGFFASGHHTSLPNIPWETAFVGFSHASTPSILSNLLPALLVSYSTASSVFLYALAVPIVFHMKLEGKAKSNGLWRDCHSFLLFHAVQLLGCMGAATIHRRHLMVWKIFAPRLLYELVLSLYATIGLILAIVINHKRNT